jgi:hypothetical protein
MLSWYPKFKFHCLLLMQPSLKLTSKFSPQSSPPEGTKMSPYRCPTNTNKLNLFPFCTSQQSTGHHAAALSTAQLYRRTSGHCLGNVRAVTDQIRPVPLTAPCPRVRIIRQFIIPVLSLWTQPEHLNSSDAHTEVVTPKRHDRGVSGCHSGVAWGAEAVMLGQWFPRRFGG